MTKAPGSNRRRKTILCFALSAAHALSAHALDLHVSPSGKDTNSGTEGAPLASLAKARDAARKLRQTPAAQSFLSFTVPSTKAAPS